MNKAEKSAALALSSFYLSMLSLNAMSAGIVDG
jgi:hypothetical protein